MSSDQSHFTESEMQAVSFKWRFKSVTPTDPPAGDDKKHVWRYRSAKWLPTGWSYFASSPEPNIGLQFGGFFTKLCLIKSFSGIISDDSYNMSQRQLDFTRFKIVFFIGHSLWWLTLEFNLIWSEAVLWFGCWVSNFRRWQVGAIYNLKAATTHIYIYIVSYHSLVDKRIWF